MARRKRRITSLRRPARRRRRLRRNAVSGDIYLKELGQALKLGAWATVGVAAHKLATAALANKVLTTSGPWKDGTTSAKYRPYAASTLTALGLIPLVTFIGTAASDTSLGKIGAGSMMSAGVVSDFIYGMITMAFIAGSKAEDYFLINEPQENATAGFGQHGMGAYLGMTPSQARMHPRTLPSTYPIGITPVQREGILSGRSGIF